ncbi:hypothetical protein NDU88_008310 [Pleurodeles waltl]|uniref:Uncharacterized protein n=1 Tax=Pleurodeles waltl TaxID=8319 RepID=A0AAV7QRE8_PLEWA|nr:hypothetical protein NDU88_008310 [Pleurodeles waltl]
MTPAVGVIVAVEPPTGWWYIPPYYDICSLAKAKPPMYHTDCLGGNGSPQEYDSAHPHGFRGFFTTMKTMAVGTIKRLSYLLAGGRPAGDGKGCCCQQQRPPAEHRQALSWILIRSAAVYWRGAAADSSATLPPSAAMTVARILPAFWRNSGYAHNVAVGWKPR